MAVPQQALDNFPCVLTDQRARQVVRGRGLREFERGILHLVDPERRMLHCQIHLAVVQLRVMLDAVCGTLHGKGANAGSLAALGQLVLPQLHAPRFYVLVQFILVLQPPGDRGEFRRIGP